MIRFALLFFRVFLWTRRKGRIPTGTIEWLVIRSLVVMRDGYKCRSCGVRAANRREVSGMFEVDHIIPVSEGGSNHFSNLQTLCRECHRKKHPWLK